MSEAKGICHWAGLIIVDLRFSPAERAFKREVQDFLTGAVPDDLRKKAQCGLAYDKHDHIRWHKILYKKGWIAPSWPKEAGGAGWSSIERYIFDQQLARTPAPMVMPFGIGMVGPVIREFGTDEQKTAFLPSIFDGTAFWCQGFSEPGAGSDLASLKTKAVRDGTDYVVNGQKIWTSYAHWADWIFCLVRTGTEGRPQDGISFLLIDMKSPGIVVRPIETIDDHHHLNEVFFEDVRVPVANRIGEENRGWSCAKFLLGHERTGLTGVAETQETLSDIRRYAAEQKSGPAGLLDDPVYRRRLTALEARLKALEITELRCLLREESGGALGAEASVLKLVGSNLQQEASELAVEALGYYANAYSPKAQRGESDAAAIGSDQVSRTLTYFLFRRAATIYGGSDEVQRSVIAKQVFGL